jgi:hypothetical protein
MTHADYLKKRDEIIVNVKCGWLDHNFATQAIDALVNEVIGEAPFNYMSGGMEDAVRISTDIQQESLRKQQRTIVNGGDE